MIVATVLKLATVYFVSGTVYLFMLIAFALMPMVVAGKGKQV